MEWPSKELEVYYTVLNKVYGATIKQKYPHVLFVSLDPENFLEQVLANKWSIDVSVYMCVDWMEKYRQDGNTDSDNAISLGDATVRYMISLQNMFTKPEEIGDRKIYPNLEINKKEYCEGIVEFVY